MKNLLTPIYERVGGLNIPTSRADKLDSIKLQMLVSSKACRFEVANCITESQNMFKRLKENPEDENM